MKWSLAGQKYRRLFWALALVLCAVGVAGCRAEPDLVVGFLGSLTGRSADLGTSGRDAVLMAINDRNAAGGINGRKLRLLVKDDRGEPRRARSLVQEMIDEGAVAILGHAVSSSVMQVLPVLDRSEVVMLNSFASADQLYRADDYLLNFNVSVSVSATSLAEYMIERRAISTCTILLDINNPELTVNWLNVFRKQFEFKGGRILSVESFAAGGPASFLDMARQVTDEQPQAVLILAGGVDTAMFVQQFRKLGRNMPVFTTPWSFTGELLTHGGAAVEGMTSVLNFNANHRSPVCRDFQARFREHYGRPPSYATGMAYDSARYLLAGLQRHPQRKGLREVLLAMGPFEGLQSSLQLDARGDVARPQYLTTIRKGRFEVVENR